MFLVYPQKNVNPKLRILRVILYFGKQSNSSSQEVHDRIRQNTDWVLQIKTALLLLAHSFVQPIQHPRGDHFGAVTNRQVYLVSSLITH